MQWPLALLWHQMQCHACQRMSARAPAVELQKWVLHPNQPGWMHYRAVSMHLLSLQLLRLGWLRSFAAGLMTLQKQVGYISRCCSLSRELSLPYALKAEKHRQHKI